MQEKVIPFLSNDAENQLLLKIAEMPEPGVIMVWDPESKTACHVLMTKGPDNILRMKRWVVQGPISQDYAHQLTREIQVAAEADGLCPSPASIN
ncbi:MAG: hypothetical protein AB2563_03900 [Candidatus Thiodiazotropha endolucinida]